MKKKYSLYFPIVLILTLFCSFKGDLTVPREKGEKIFLKHADDALSVIAKTAGELKIQGVAMVIFIPGDSVRSWISKMEVVGHLRRGNYNMLAYAGSKVAEMADTYKDSGSGIRPPIKGEYGYPGGVIMKVSSGYLMTVFAGGESSDDDKAAATAGLNFLSQFFK
ncbi:hypothetical protein [Pedobacter sp. L105]|uniref:hypothetical protein n=1 Tax=Pedobacter sp. L105 TaxID=1641871 RepID=UPI00131D2A78|nr:hypothetical protein [Pedobacter sp. L105]